MYSDVFICCCSVCCFSCLFMYTRFSFVCINCFIIKIVCLFLYFALTLLRKLNGFIQIREIKRQSETPQQELVFRFSGKIGIIRQKMRAHFSFLRDVRANVRIFPRKSGTEVLKLFYLLARGNLRLLSFFLLRLPQVFRLRCKNEKCCGEEHSQGCDFQ